MDPRPETVLEWLEDGDLEAARVALDRAFANGPPRTRTDEWAEAAEAVGASLLALQAWQAVLAANRNDAKALERLALLHEERGDLPRADACRRRLADLLGEEAADAPTPENDGDEVPPPPLGEPGDGDLVRFVHLFQGREGVHARQWYDPRRGAGYSPVQGPLTVELARSHLGGGITLGSYLVRRDNVTGQLVFDLDARRAAVEAAAGDPDRVADLARRIHDAGLHLLRGLRAAGLDPILVDSGYKGRHLWCFFDPPEPAAEARNLGLGWAAALAPDDPDLAVEVFPRQGRVPPGRLGNLVKLPLGIHRRTGRRCHLLDDEGQPLLDPWERLRAVRRVPLGRVRRPPPRLATGRSGRATRARADDAASGEGGDSRDTHDAAPDPAAGALPPAPPPAPFTAADFEARPRLAAVLSGCAVLRAAVDEVLATSRIDRDVQVALEHSVGHLPEGVEGINYLLTRCGVPASQHMKSPHSGHPVSCRRLRSRLARLAQDHPCTCPKGDERSYPHPLLFARGVPAEAPRPDVRPLPELLDAIQRLEARLVRIQAELAALRREAAERVAALPGGRFQAETGTWIAEEQEGIPALRLERGAAG